MLQQNSVKKKPHNLIFLGWISGSRLSQLFWCQGQGDLQTKHETQLIC
jgi:hypothetical protein